MYDKNKVLIGILVFLGLFTFPFWFNHGKAAPVPKPVLVTQEKACVMPLDYMKSSHMQLLNTWRDQVVREDLRAFTAPTGRTFSMSLANTCTDCHKNKTQFCDQCHTYMAVDPNCWDCHIAPKEAK